MVEINNKDIKKGEYKDLFLRINPIKAINLDRDQDNIKIINIIIIINKETDFKIC